MKYLLNIDGGGIRVYFPLLILNYIEKKTGKKIIDLFDIFCGVSASSIILSGLLMNYSTDEVIKIFKEISKKIFNKSYIYSLKSLFGLTDSKYPETYIEQELKQLLGAPLGF
jgi:patatin-like phospholipase/acyl hydrolase